VHYLFDSIVNLDHVLSHSLLKLFTTHVNVRLVKSKVMFVIMSNLCSYLCNGLLFFDPGSLVLSVTLTNWARKLPVVYHAEYNISFWGLEKLHPFDPCKFRKV